MYPAECELTTLIEKVKKRGFLSFHDVDDFLPDEGGDPSLVDHLVHALEETGLDLRKDPERSQAEETPEDSVSLGGGTNGNSHGHSPLDSPIARSLLGQEYERPFRRATPSACT